MRSSWGGNITIGSLVAFWCSQQGWPIYLLLFWHWSGRFWWWAWEWHCWKGNLSLPTVNVFYRRRQIKDPHSKVRDIVCGPSPNNQTNLGSNNLLPSYTWPPKIGQPVIIYVHNPWHKENRDPGGLPSLNTDSFFYDAVSFWRSFSHGLGPVTPPSFFTDQWQWLISHSSVSTQ